jgi:hypothetical protein
VSFVYEDELNRIKSILDDTGETVEFGPAAESDIEYLEGLLYPDSVIAFYEAAEPSSWVEINGAILTPVSDIWGENENGLPGDVVIEFGFLNIGGTASGDGYWLDSSKISGGGEPPVVLMAHDQVSEGQGYNDIRHACAPVADSFKDFLNKFSHGLLPENALETMNANMDTGPV